MGDATLKGYEKEQFTDAWNRYTSSCPGDLSVTAVTPDTNQAQPLSRNISQNPQNVTAIAQAQSRYDVTPVTAESQGQECDRYESVLGMTKERVTELWRKEGAPLIHLGPGENCEDLEKLFTNHDCPERHLKAIKAWLDKVLQRRGEL